VKILTSFCEHLKILREILPEHEIRCIEEADDEFVERSEILIVFHWKDVGDVVPKMKNLRLIQTLTAGTDHIRGAPSNAIIQSNAGVNARAVAEHALSLYLSAVKKIPYRDRKMRKGEFPQLLESQKILGKKALIIGFGHIGQELGRMLSCLGIRVSAINRSGEYNGDIKLDRIGTLRDLDDMLPYADAIFISLPLSDETRGLIDKRRLELMKKNAILVNTSRGKIIVEKDLYDHLRENPEFTAAIDTWWHYDKKFRQDYPFEELDNIILSPHCAGTYGGWFEEMVRGAGLKVVGFVRDYRK